MGVTTGFLRAGTALAGLVMATPAVAQTAAASGGDAGSSEIVVTAQRRAERLIETPLSISILSAERLASSGATQFRDFADRIPGLSFQTSGPGYTQISLRGISAGSDAGATVAIYVDDIPIGSSTTYARGGQTTFDSSLFDLERVEVLRGPQGTLYGASSMGGVLKYVTAMPDAGRFSGKIMAGAAVTAHGDPGYNVAGLVNAPVVADKVALRVSAFYTRTGGYIDNPPLGQKDINSSKIYGGRADLLLSPSERLDIRLTGFAQNIKNDGFPFADYTLRGAPVRGPLDANRPVDEPFESKLRLAAGTVTYDLDFAKLTSITSYQTNRTQFLLYSASTTNALRPFGA